MLDILKTPSCIHIGSAYYPEHWPEERWPEDIRLMNEAGLTVARMGEFAWSTFEPSEGDFHFDWMDRAIEMLAAKGILTVLGTPTAAPPAWLVKAIPDMLAVEENGQRVQFGNRCHYCVTSPEFHAAARRIVSAMAAHFGKNSKVIGWQFDNEYNRVCYCDRCRAQFQQFLAQKYGTLDELNAHWSTAYWSQTYDAWDEIPLPIGGHNPGLMLEFKHFVTDCYRKFQRIQIDELRPHLHENAWVTHNFMGWFGGFDHYELTQDLDLATWDWYIGTGHNDPLRTGAIHDLTRGFKRQNFWVMETQPGSVNWSPYNNMVNKGEARAMAWEAVAHGADGILYWQWRTALGGQEQYHGTLVDQSGQQRPFYREAQKLAFEFRQLSQYIAGSNVKARVAMLNDYDSRWSIEWQRHQREFDYVEYFNHFYRPISALNLNIDVLAANQITDVAQLKEYRVIVAPAMLIVNEQQRDALTAFVKRGGSLILTARCGMKDQYNALHPMRQPGPLAELAGVEVEEYYALQPKEQVAVKGNLFEGTCRVWAERLKLLNNPSTAVIARYGKSNGWLDDQPAVTVSVVGNGFVYYVGTLLDVASQKAMMEKVMHTAGFLSFNSHTARRGTFHPHPARWARDLFRH